MLTRTAKVNSYDRDAMSSAPAQTSEPPATPAPPEARFRRSAFAAFLLAEIGAFVFYFVISRPMWFYLDEWDFLADRTGGNLGDLFRAHNEHWVTLPVVVYRVLWWIFGLNTYRPYQIAIIVLHLLAALLVRAVMRRVGVRPWTATITACVLVFLGSGYQNIVFPFQITLVGALVFGLAHLMLANHDGPFDRRDLFGLAAGCAGLMCSGVAVSMVIAVGVSMLLARGWRMALVHTAPLAAIYMTWFLTIGHVGYDNYHATPGQIASFIRNIIAAIFHALGHGRGVSVVLGVLLVVGLVVAWIPLGNAAFRRQAAMPLALLVGAMALLLITGIGRAGLGNFKEMSRYLHLVAAMVLPAIGLAADAVMKRSRWLIAPVVVVLLAGVPGNVRVISDYMHKGIITNQKSYKAMMLSLPRSPVAKDVPRDVKPEQFLARFITVGWLLDGVAAGRIPKPGPIPAANKEMDVLRLSFHQYKHGVRTTDECTGLATPLVFELDPGQRIVVLGPTSSIRVIPVSSPFLGTFPWRVVTRVGNELVAVRPVQFRLVNDFAPIAQVCSDLKTMTAARAAGDARLAAQNHG